MATRLVAPLLFFVFLLAGCGESNPYIGTWEGKLDSSDPRVAVLNMLGSAMGGGQAIPSVTIIFSEKECTVFDGKTEQRTPVIYKKGEKGYAASTDGGKSWEYADFKDKNTMILNGMGISMTLTKVK